MSLIGVHYAGWGQFYIFHNDHDSIGQIPKYAIFYCVIPDYLSGGPVEAPPQLSGMWYLATTLYQWRHTSAQHF